MDDWREPRGAARLQLRVAVGDRVRRFDALVAPARLTAPVQLREQHAADEMRLNDIGTVRLRLSAPLMVDPYADNRATGAFILVGEATNDTVAAGMVRSATA